MLLAGAVAVAVLHGAAVLFMLTGALLAARRPRLLLLHAPVAAIILAVNLAGAPCPLTVWELDLRAAAGAPAYEGGFLGHYLFAPLGLDVRSTAVQVGMYAVAAGLNALGYGLALSRARARRRSPAPARARPGAA
ncbi:DUF2784 domain-containing protein [Geodermatophilus sp. SYSU D00815]